MYPVLLTRSCAALGLLVVLGGCSETKRGSVFSGVGFSDDGGNEVGQAGDDSDGCALGLFCNGGTDAIFDLSCGPTDLTSVVISGPCATGDASLSNHVSGSESQYVSLSSPSPGVCHVELTFATGFTYSADVTFVSESVVGPCACPSSTAPTQNTFMVNNPSTTCVDAGVDAGEGG
jgi:hypothetical protein